MDKFTKMFIEHNPKFEITCGNSKCRKKSKVITIDVFSKNTYDFECPYCHTVTQIENGKSAFEEIKKSLKKFS